MRVRLDYGTSGLEVELPSARTTIVEPIHQSASEHPQRLLTTALREPVAGPALRDIAQSGQSVAISVCDITRPQPRELMLEAILDELDGRMDQSYSRRFGGCQDTDVWLDDFVQTGAPTPTTSSDPPYLCP